MRPPHGALLFVVAALLGAPGAAEAQDAKAEGAPIPVDDFEQPALRADWKFDQAEGRIVPGPAGGALEIVGRGVAKDSLPRAWTTLPISDLRRIGAVAFRASLEGPAARLQVFLRKGDTLRTLEEVIWFQQTEWQEVVLPLRYMIGGSSGLLPDPASLDRIQFQWEGTGGVLRIDDIRLLPGDRGTDSWRPSEEDLLELAFGKGKGKVLRGKTYSFLSDHPAWQGPDAVRMLADLEKTVALVKSRWGLEAPLGVRIPILCGAHPGESERLRAKAHGSYWGAGLRPANALDCGMEPYEWTDYPPVRSEAGKPRVLGTRLLAAHSLGTAGDDWLSHAIFLAVLERLDPGGKRGFGRVFASDFSEFLAGRPGKVLPWAALMDGDNGFEETAVLPTVAEYLAACHRPKLPKAWEAVRALEGDPDQGAMLAIAEALGSTPAKLEQHWARWGATSWK